MSAVMLFLSILIMLVVSYYGLSFLILSPPHQMYPWKIHVHRIAIRYQCCILLHHNHVRPLSSVTTKGIVVVRTSRRDSIFKMNIERLIEQWPHRLCELEQAEIIRKVMAVR